MNQPAYKFRILRQCRRGHVHTHHYKTREARDAAAAGWAVIDQHTVTKEFWSPDNRHDSLNQGWACDGIAEPTQSVSAG